MRLITPPETSVAGRAAALGPPLHFLASAMRTNVYVDGFNLYYGCLKGTPYKWLNLEVLFDELLDKNDVRTIH